MQSPQRDLQKHMRKDSLEKALKERPQKEDLVKGGILKEDEVEEEEEALSG